MVYHANYLRFFERGRSDHLRDAGVSHQSLLAREDPAAFTLTNVNVTYRKPGKVDDLLHIRTRYLGMDGPRIRFSQACLRDGEVIAEAEITAVMIHADGRLRRPIKEIAELLEAFRWAGKD
jgi:acyl-CoA thioester hydrolase